VRGRGEGVGVGGGGLGGVAMFFFLFPPVATPDTLRVVCMFGFSLSLSLCFSTMTQENQNQKQTGRGPLPLSLKTAHLPVRRVRHDRQPHRLAQQGGPRPHHEAGGREDGDRVGEGDEELQADAGGRGAEQGLEQARQDEDDVQDDGLGGVVPQKAGEGVVADDAEVQAEKDGEGGEGDGEIELGQGLQGDEDGAGGGVGQEQEASEADGVKELERGGVGGCRRAVENKTSKDWTTFSKPPLSLPPSLSLYLSPETRTPPPRPPSPPAARRRRRRHARAQRRRPPPAARGGRGAGWERLPRWQGGCGGRGRGGGRGGAMRTPRRSGWRGGRAGQPRAAWRGGQCA
jgi:hypothetical protein